MRSRSPASALVYREVCTPDPSIFDRTFATTCLGDGQGSLSELVRRVLINSS
jgi:hypothetical protein